LGKLAELEEELGVIFSPSLQVPVGEGPEGFPCLIKVPF